MQLLASPWASTFETFTRTITRSAVMVSPFITREPLQQLARHLQSLRNVQVEILTNLSTDSMVQGAISPRALVEFCSAIPATKVRHLPGLHAKVYIADGHTAIITSANLTRGGLINNYEYGVQITDPVLVGQVVDDLEAYSALGAEVPLFELTQLADAAEELQERNSRILASATQTLRREFEEKVTETRETLLGLRAKSSESTNAIFSRTILYILRRGPLTTQHLHPLIQQIHPDLCDDTIDRVIGGVHFGKEWKHRVRSAQSSLKWRGLITLDGQLWHLATR